MGGLASANRGAIVVIGLLVVLGLLAVVARSSDDGQVEGPDLSMHVTADNGGRALFLWLAELGYDTRALQYRTFEIGSETDALFILAPLTEMSAGDAAQTLRWVESGGTLLIASQQPARLLDDLGVGLERAEIVEARPLQPVFLDPPVETVRVETTTGLDLPGPIWLPLLGGESGEPVAAVAERGRGRVYLLSSEHVFSNTGIAEADNTALAQHVLAGVPPGGTILFDEYHHGLTEHGTLTQRIVREPWGWAVLWLVVFTFAWLVFSGRRFGKALPPPPSWARRSSGEYVATLGAMLRRGKHDDWLRQHYAAQVKRGLGHRYRIRADQPAREFVTALAARRADAADLAIPLEHLEVPGHLDEATSLALIRDIDIIQRRLTGVTQYHQYHQ